MPQPSRLFGASEAPNARRQSCRSAAVLKAMCLTRVNIGALMLK